MAEMTLILPNRVPDTENSRAFHQAMIDRMGMSFFKYGPVAEAKGKIDQIASLQMRLNRYARDGNTEWLVDVANMAMIEFMHRGPQAFHPTTERDSPGRTWLADEWDGSIEVSNRANDGTPQD